MCKEWSDSLSVIKIKEFHFLLTQVLSSRLWNQKYTLQGRSFFAMCEEERYGELVCFSAIWAANLHLYNPLRKSVNNFLEAILLKSHKAVRLDPACTGSTHREEKA